MGRESALTFLKLYNGNKKLISGERRLRRTYGDDLLCDCGMMLLLLNILDLFR